MSDKIAQPRWVDNATIKTVAENLRQKAPQAADQTTGFPDTVHKVILRSQHDAVTVQNLMDQLDKAQGIKR